MHESWGSIPFYLEHYQSINIWSFQLAFVLYLMLWYHQLVSLGIWYLLHRYLFQLILIVGVLIPYFFILLYLISVKYYPLLGIFSPSWYLIFNWCLIDHVLFWFDSYWYHTSCVDVFWNQSYVDLIFSSIMCWFGFWDNLDNLFVSHFGVLSSWFTWCFRPNCISFGSWKTLHVYSLIYILYGMFVFLVPIYRGYSTES